MSHFLQSGRSGSQKLDLKPGLHGLGPPGWRNHPGDGVGLLWPGGRRWAPTALPTAEASGRRFVSSICLFSVLLFLTFLILKTKHI